MCGIVGVITPSAESLGEDFLDNAVDAMRLRGPDDRGLRRFTDERTGAQVWLGQRRLSILDLSAAGHQPMASADGQVWAVYNGEVYNFQDIRAELESAGVSFRSNSDTEILIAAYQRWGIDFVQRCNGMFALALWDARASRLVLYRDRVGIKPLYISRQNGRFYFGSVLTALMQVPGFRKEVDPNALLAYMRMGYVPGPYAILRDTQKLMPGHWAVYDLREGSLTIRPYWQVSDILESGPANGAPKPIDAYVDETEALLSDAVRRCLISDVPLGAFLSGGIDSSVVVALMKKVHAQATRTFSIGFDVPGFNEAPAARAMAQSLGTEHTEYIVKPEDARAAALEVPRVYDEPFSDSSCLPSMLLARLTRQSVTVALSGDGGDECFYGAYDHYRLAGLWRRGAWVPRPVRATLGKAVARMARPRMRRIGEALQARDYGQFYQLSTCIWNRRIHPGLVSGDVDSAMAELPHSRVARQLERLSCATPHLATALDFYSLLPDDFLVKVDRASMGSSLEVRVPLLDYRVVEYCRRLPVDVLFHGGEHKYLLKRVLERHVPRSLWERPKQGFAIPLAHWFRDELRGFLREQLLDAGGLPFDVFSRPVVERIVDLHQSGAMNCDRLLWSLTSLSMWYREHLARA